MLGNSAIGIKKKPEIFRILVEIRSVSGEEVNISALYAGSTSSVRVLCMPIKFDTH